MFSRTDEQLVSKALSGNKRAWFELISRYEQAVFNYAMRMTNHSADAKDLMQEIFIAVFNSLSSYKRTGSFKAWVFKIAHFKCMDFYRRKKPNLSLDDNPDIEHTSDFVNENKTCIESNLLDGESKQGVLNVLSQLSFNQKTVIELKFFSQFTFDEIAEQLGVSSNTVKSRLYSALAKLKAIMEVEHV